MTAPVFDTLPQPTPNSLADLPTMSAAQASTMDGNFKKVNDFLRPLTFSGAVANFSAPAISRNFPDNTQDLVLAEWPTLNLTVPSKFSIATAWINFRDYSPQGVAMTVVLTGAGVTTQQTGAPAVIAGCYGRWGTAGGTQFFPASVFIPGKVVTLTVWHKVWTPEWNNIYDGNYGLAFV